MNKVDSSPRPISTTNTRRAEGPALRRLSDEEKAAVAEQGLKTHTVVKGDTLWAIAKRNGVSLKDLAAANPELVSAARGGGAQGNRIYPGDEVVLPKSKGWVAGGGEVKPPPQGPPRAETPDAAATDPASSVVAPAASTPTPEAQFAPVANAFNQALDNVLGTPYGQTTARQKDEVAFVKDRLQAFTQPDSPLANSPVVKELLAKVAQAEAHLAPPSFKGTGPITQQSSGWMQNLSSGEKAKASVRAGELTRDGATEGSRSLRLSVADKKVTEQEQRQAANFARALGATNVPTPTKFGGQGTFEAQVVIPDSGFKKLDTVSAEQMKKAYGAAFKQLEGTVAPWENDAPSSRNPSYRNEKFGDPPSVKARFEEAMKDWKMADFGSDLSEQDRIRRDYKATTGRDFEQDYASHQAMNELAARIGTDRNKSPAKREQFLEDVGNMPSREMRLALLTLQQTADAQILSSRFSANGVEVSTP